MRTKERRRRVEEFTEVEIRSIESRMRDPEFSSARFLGASESLVDCIEADRAVLESLGIRYDQIADRLETICGRADRASTLRWRTQGLGSDEDGEDQPTEIVDDRFEVSSTSYMGYQECPFEYQKTKEKCETCGLSDWDVSIRNRVTGGALWCAGLMIHLIRAHHFFEGRGLPYRLDPTQAVEVLELRPGVDYAPVFGEESLWSRGRDSSIERPDLVPAAFWPVEEPEPGIAIHRRPDGGCVVRVAEGCGGRAIQFDGAVMELWDSGIQTFERKETLRFVR